MKKYYRIILLLFLSVSVSYSQMFGNEPTERERTYDVQNIKIEVKLDLKKKVVEGRVTTSLRSLVDNLTSFKVDAVGMNIKNVKGWYHVATNDPRSAELFEDIKFEYDKKEITIYPRTGIKKNFPYKYQVEYTTVNPEKGLYFIAPDSIFPGKRYEVWTQGEGEDNRYWFPCYDYPNDKATTEVVVTADSNYHTLSNGKLESVVKNKGGTKTWTWVQDIRHSSYLVMLAVGKYHIIEEKYQDIPVDTYVPPGTKNTSIKSFDETVSIIRFFSEKLNYKYPWSKYSQVVVQDFIYGGMENTGAVVLYEGTLYDDRVPPDYSTTSLIAHEVAHQWWGDVVTFKNWNEIWLSEGFATYFEAMYKEVSMGKDEFDYTMLKRSDEVIAADELNRKPVYTRKGSTVNTYSKGAIVLHMLRNIMSDGLFLKALNNYITKHEFENVTTKDFLNAVTDVYNNPQLDMVPRDFTGFFNEWIFQAGQPEFEVSYDYYDGARNVTLYVQQVQKRDDGLVFSTPIDVKIITENSSWFQVITTTNERKAYNVALDGKLLDIVFNKDNIVLSKVYFNKPKAHWFYQLNTSVGAIDRIMAARGLRDFINDEDVIADLIGRLRTDKFWGVRYEAAKVLANSSSERIPQILMDAFDNENDSRVRRSFLNALSDYYTANPDKVSNSTLTDFIIERIKKDKSYYVIADGISAISKIADKERVYVLISEYAEQDSHNEIIRRSAIDALTSVKDSRAIDIFKRYAVKGSTARLRSIAITGLADYLNDPSVVEVLNGKLSDGNRGIRVKTVDILSRAPSSSSRPYLQKLLEQTNDNDLAVKIRDLLGKMD